MQTVATRTVLLGIHIIRCMCIIYYILYRPRADCREGADFVVQGCRRRYPSVRVWRTCIIKILYYTRGLLKCVHVMYTYIQVCDYCSYIYTYIYIMCICIGVQKRNRFSPRYTLLCIAGIIVYVRAHLHGYKN